MTQDEIIEMARQAGVRDDERIFEFSQYKYLERFVNLVSDKATEEANARANASWELMCKKMVEFEREACAKVAERFEPDEKTSYVTYASTAIRARGQA
jgi:hypothetical protein